MFILWATGGCADQPNKHMNTNELPPPYPLCWPESVPRTKNRQPDRFRVTLDVARKELLQEIDMFSGKSPVVTSSLAAFETGDTKEPGIAVWFYWKGQVRCVACDTYGRLVANVRAVGLTIAALRTMENYGTQMLDQLMSGVAALPSAGEGWWNTLRCEPSATLAEIHTAYRTRAKQLHPDTENGDEVAFKELCRAYEQAKLEVKV